MKTNLRFLSWSIFILLAVSLIANAQNIENKALKSAVNIEKQNKDNSNLLKTFEIVDFSGEGTYEIFPDNESGWTFFGPTRQITVSGKRKIAGFGSAVFGTNSGTSRIAISLCYAKDGGAITSFEGDNHLIADADALRRTFSVSVSGTLDEGTYSVGYCVVNRGPQILGNNDYVNGWILAAN
jgi:hypothetical protein